MNRERTNLLPYAAVCFASLSLAQILRETPPTEVIVETTPRAEIFQDEPLRGEAPANGALFIHNAKPGEHMLRVTFSGKEPFTKKVIVSAGMTVCVRAALVDQKGDLEVLTTPRGRWLVLTGTHLTV